MKVHAIVQARMGSTRLPGKVMREIKGKPLIGWLLDRITQAKLPDKFIVAIPRKDIEGRLGHYLALRNDVYVVGGSEDDVADRFSDVLNFYPCDAFVRVCGDSPLIDAAMIDEIIASQGDFQGYNILCGGVGGTTLECIGADLFLENLPYMNPEEREHVTLYWRNRLSLCVDTEEDFQRVAAVIEAFDKEPGDMEECLDELAQQL